MITFPESEEGGSDSGRENELLAELEKLDECGAVVNCCEEPTCQGLGKLVSYGDDDGRIIEEVEGD
jgi:hypothetical protein